MSPEVGGSRGWMPSSSSLQGLSSWALVSHPHWLDLHPLSPRWNPATSWEWAPETIVSLPIAGLQSAGRAPSLADLTLSPSPAPAG